jgi:single-strand DNA-binding protein
MNQVTLIGNLCRDIEIKQTQSGSNMGFTAIAVQRDRKNDKGEYETDFFDLKLFNSQADFASNYLHKGSKVCVSGRIQIRDYVNREGIKGRAVEILVNTIENLDPKKQETTETKTTEDVVAIADEDLPF